MARPKKSDSSGDERNLNINYKNYLSVVNFQANLIQSQKENAQHQLTIASANLNNAGRLLEALKGQATVVMLGNDVNLDMLAVEYPHLHRLLTAENSEKTGGTAGLEDAPEPTTIKPAKPKKQRKERDPNAPKRPLTAFFLFLQDKRDETTEKMKVTDPGFKPGDVQKRNTELWNALGEDQQQPYKDKYEANMQAYKKELERYKAQTGQDIPPIEADEKEEEEEEEPATAAPSYFQSHAEEESTKSEDEDEDENEDENGAAAGPRDQVPESEDESDESEETPPPPKKESKKSAAKAAKEASPEKKTKAAVKEEKKPKKVGPRSASPEVPKKKRKAEVKEAPKPEKKKKARKSAGYNGNDEDF